MGEDVFWKLNWYGGHFSHTQVSSLSWSIRLEHIWISVSGCYFMSAGAEETYVDMEDTNEKVVDKVAMDVVDIVYLSAEWV